MLRAKRYLASTKVELSEFYFSEDPFCYISRRLAAALVRARTAISHFLLPLNFLVVLASSIGGDLLFWDRFAMQTTAQGSGTSESGW